MSIDIDLVREENGEYVSLIHSGGIYRIFTGKIKDGKIGFLRLSSPISPENLTQLQILLSTFDAEEYEEVYKETILRERQTRETEFANADMRGCVLVK